MTQLFPTVMGDDFLKLCPSVARFHGTGPGALAEGSLRVRRGDNLLANWLGHLLRVPHAAESLPVRVEVLQWKRGEHWRRHFGSRRFESRMWEHQGLLVEAFGPARFGFQLDAKAGNLLFQTVGCWLLGLPIPGTFRPNIRVKASPSVTEPESDAVFSIFVEMTMPWLGRIVEYSGEMRQISTGKQLAAGENP